MNFMEYSNKTHSNIIPKESFEGLVHDVFDVIATNIAKSLGPLGSSATILDGMQTEATKDGYAILKSYRFHNRYKRLVYNLIKAPCNRMNNTVGDGTTTAIVLANYLFQNYQNRKSALDKLHRLPRTFIQAWDDVIRSIIVKIKDSAKPLNPEDYDSIYNLCYVTSNGNKEISKNIAETYLKSKAPIIKQKDSPTNKSYISPIVGFEFPGNLIDEAYVRSEDLSVEERDLCVMIFDHKIESDFCTNFIIPVNEVLKAMNKKLLILAPSYDALMCNTTLKQYVNYEYNKNKSLNLIIGQYALGKLEPHQLTDLATVLRTWVINQELSAEIMKELTGGSEMTSIDKLIDETMENDQYKFYRMIGTANTALLSCTNGAIFRVNNIEEDDKYCDVLRAAKKELADIVATTDHERQAFASKIYEANARIAQLEMQNYIYYVGADSALQKKITWDSIEDVIKCVRSAIKSGYVPGCQLSIIKGCITLLHEMIGGLDKEEVAKLSDDIKLRLLLIELIQSAVLDVYSTILHGPEGRGIIKLIPLWQYAGKDGAEELQKESSNKAIKIIQDSIINHQVFDLESLEFNGNIITSAETDIMVLMASSELIKILISGNQCIFLDSEINNTHNEEVEIYG